jgi:hypothetical protein
MVKTRREESKNQQTEAEIAPNRQKEINATENKITLLEAKIVENTAC